MSTLNVPGYHNLKKIHESTISSLYRASRTSDGMAVVLKILEQEHPSPEILFAFQQECEIAARVKSERVIQMFGCEKFGNRHIIIQEDFGGRSLALWLKKEPIPLKTFLNLAVKITEGLEHIHNSQVIHKDINTSNIIWNPQTDQLKLIDFGISTLFTKELPPTASLNELEGTLPYLSPEQTGRMNRTIDKRTDFYSLGVTLYELSTSSLPFYSEDIFDLIYSHMAREPLPPHKINPDIPKVLSSIIMKLLSKDVEDRYQSASGLLADLVKCMPAVSAGITPRQFPLGEKDIVENIQLPQKFYGRKQEIEILKNAWEQAMQGRLEIVLVAGYAGIGKTSLVRELYKPITRSRGLFVSGKFEPYRQNTPMSALIDAFGGLIRQLLTGNDEQLEQWRIRILDALNGAGQLIIDVIPELENIIGTQPLLEQVGVEETGNRFKQVFLNFISVFGRSEQALMIFLDDLQWVDSATLSLLESLSVSEGMNYILVIGAFRDNEIEMSDPLMVEIGYLEKKKISVKRIDLKPLPVEMIEQMLADALMLEREKVRPLVEQVVEKTNGNPFFVNQFLTILYQEKILFFDKGAKKWRWNLQKIGSFSASDNVIELIRKKLSQLPADLQRLCGIAACIGNFFDLNLLAEIDDTSMRKVFIKLLSVVDQGLVLPAPERNSQYFKTDYFLNLRYRFLHDRIRQEAYELSSSEDRKYLHLKIGRILYDRYRSSNQSVTIHQILAHMNVSLDLIEGRQKREIFSRMNLEAGKSARKAAAYDQAAHYFQTGIELLPTSTLHTPLDLAFDLYQEAAECMYLIGEFARSELLLNQGFSYCRSKIDQGVLTVIRIKHKSAQAQYSEAIDIGLDALCEHGINLPEMQQRKEIYLFVTDEIKWFENHWGYGKIDNLLDLPIAHDPIHNLVMTILGTLLDCAIIASPDYVRLLAIKMVNLSIQNGNTPFSPLGYLWQSGMIASVNNDYENAFYMGNAALTLNDKILQNKAMQCKLLNTFACFVGYLKKSYSECSKIFKKAVLIGRETGDYLYTAYSITNGIRARLTSGYSLEKMESKVEISLSRLLALNNQPIYLLTQISLGFIKCLKGKTSAPDSIDFEGFSEKTFRSQFAETPIFISFMDIYKLRLHFTFENFDKALEIVNTFCIDPISAYFHGEEFHFFAALTLSAVCPDDSDKRLGFLETISDHHYFIQKLARVCPQNFKAHELMVAAEISRIKGDVMAAVDIYDSAIKAAKESGLIQDQAIANELAARFWLGRDKKEFAGLYIKKAHNCYRLWGAVRKTGCIEEKHGQLLAINTDLNNSNTMDSQRLSSSDIWMKNTNILDYNSLIKSSIAITGKIHIEELLEELIQILVKNTGARTGYLALVSEKNLSIVAEAADEDISIYNKTQYPIFACNNLSHGIVNYVRNTMKTVVLNDASSNTRFISDEYLSGNRIKSVLCTPIIKQKVLAGILYLENSLATNVFTPSRVEMTRILATQAASMLENAYLFNDYKESERKYRALVENLTDIIVRIDCKHRFVYASPSFLQIMSASPDIVGKTYAESGIAESLAVFFQLHIQEIYCNRDTIETEFIIKSAKDQEMRVLNWRFFPEFDEENKMMSVLGISRDITQSRQAEKEKANLKAQLAQSQKMEAVGTLAGGIAHDFNNILGIILGYSELLLFKVNDHSIRSNIDNIMKAGNRAKELIQQLLSFTRKTEQIPKPVKISLIIKETIKLLRSSIPAHIDIRSKISSQNDIVTADPTQIHQILLNLCTNAAHSMDEAGGILDVVLTTDTQVDKKNAKNNQNISPGRYLKLVVKDTGSGIDPSIIDKIFDPYFTTKGLGEGTGMGLSMVHGIVKAHKGAISVSSKPEEGSVFTILLPATDIPEVSIPKTENIILVGGNENILLVDDESMILEVTSKMLKRLGYKVSASENPQKALDLFQDQKDIFDLVITDMNMPSMTGDMLAMKILAIRPDIPIIICTGYNKRITHEKACELGVRKLLAKPLNKQKLAAAVRDVLERK